MRYGMPIAESTKGQIMDEKNGWAYESVPQPRAQDVFAERAYPAWALALAFALAAALVGLTAWGLPVYAQRRQIQALEERVELQRDLLRLQEQTCASTVQVAARCELVLKDVRARLGLGMGGP